MQNTCIHILQKWKNRKEHTLYKTQKPTNQEKQLSEGIAGTILQAQATPLGA